MSAQNQQKDVPDETPGFFDKARNVRIMMIVFYCICALLVILDFVVHRHIYMEWENIPAFYAIYGFVACVLLVVIAKQMRKVLMRPESYYQRDASAATHDNEGDR